MSTRNRNWIGDFCAALERANVQLQFWACPIDGHSEGTWRTESVPTVEWRDDVAYCLAPSCSRTSANAAETG